MGIVRVEVVGVKSGDVTTSTGLVIRCVTQYVPRRPIIPPPESTSSSSSAAALTPPAAVVELSRRLVHVAHGQPQPSPPPAAEFEHETHSRCRVLLEVWPGDAAESPSSAPQWRLKLSLTNSLPGDYDLELPLKRPSMPPAFLLLKVSLTVPSGTPTPSSSSTSATAASASALAASDSLGPLKALPEAVAEADDPVSAKSKPKPKPKTGAVVADSGYSHAKYAPKAGDDYIRNFTAYTSCFDGPDDDDGDGISDLMGVPTWVSYEIKAVSSNYVFPKYQRPKWATDKGLFDNHEAPDDKSYKGKMPETRGHMCMKKHADRISETAGKETHNMMNACPQTQVFNAGIWLMLEQKCSKWADTFGKIWVIAGPAFERTSADVETMGTGNEFAVWVPDMFWKVIIREDSGHLELLAFLFNHRTDKDGNEWQQTGTGAEDSDSSSSSIYDLNDYIVPLETVISTAKLDWTLPEFHEQDSMW
ncbi:DNA/RNA non-specific endonuclease [Pelomyxa schiedti]|nr:DNA/RNA non-specific endonuclease [Pelomyxa schiedti]